MSDFIDDLCKRVELAARNNTQLRPVGGGTKNFYGGPLQGEEVDMRQWAGIVEYEPTELVITVKPGTPLAEVEAALAAQKQELAFEPPRIGEGGTNRGTIGGAIASGLAGPARLSRGGVKDYVLGCTLLDGKGQLLHFGGVVMKNVAGYDVARVIPGSMGTLGIATELSIKVMPVAPAEATLQFEMDVNKAIAQSNEWLSKPLPISATFFENGKLTVRLRGASAAVQAAIKNMGGQEIAPAPAQAFWTSVRDQNHEFFNREGDLWRLAVPPTTVDLAMHGQSVHEWGSGLRWFRADESSTVNAEQIRAIAKRVGGHATLYRTGNEAARVHAFQQPDAVMLKLQRRLKEQFDPAGVFSINRLSPIL
ncbi:MULTISPECIES: glycolate oxidase subunit GlcE [unclassified Limnobacter]|uniref:glycolate oxidase subunit GlcE n=1 Tax=unclassified Limnobacter TaxID=2630203 RepID=UPI0025B810AD|nr:MULTISPECIES: glycolate oxidase subunit GlcE [unclassified Limnobacter]|tara:strand:+ start:1652 stop:2746 length:1095 start_codon:yes stop_codon:yes gene_type:complete